MPIETTAVQPPQTPQPKMPATPQVPTAPAAPKAPGIYTAGGAPQITVNKANPAAFMNPYQQQALNPVIRNIEEAGNRQRNQIGGLAAQGGAFGDDRHRMLDQGSYKDQGQAIADTTAKMMFSGWESALGASERDVDRMMGAGQFNAGMQNQQMDRQWQGDQAGQNRSMQWEQFLMGLDQTEKDRALTAAGLGNDIALSQQGQMMQYGQQAADLDNYIRGWTQQNLNAKYDDYMQRLMWPMTTLNSARGTSSAVPSQYYTPKADDGFNWGQLAGSVLGGLFG